MTAAAMANDPGPQRAHDGLRRYNAAMGLLHAIQGGAIVGLANNFTLPVNGTFLEGPPGSPMLDPVRLANVSVAWAVAAFLFLSAVFHLLISGPFFERYSSGLALNHNYFRWVEYSLSSSLMIVVIAMLTGISDAAALIALFGVNVSMILFGVVQEKYERPGGSLVPFWLGYIAGAVPWVAIGLYLFTPGSRAEPPGFVYGIFFSLFVFFNIFALNMWLQYRQAGRWRHYLHGEKTYVLLSLVAKSALAWQVFGGTLAL